MQTGLSTASSSVDAPTAAGDINDLFPTGSSLEDIVRVTATNTDLPPTAALFSGYSFVSAALAQAGFTIDSGSGDLMSPNLPLALIVSDDTTLGRLNRDIIRRVFREPTLDEIHPSMTAASLFSHAARVNAAVPIDAAGATERRCVSFLQVIEAQDWLKALHTQAALGKLLRQLCVALEGEQLHQWTNKKGDESSPPLYLSALLMARQSQFFASLGGLFFSSPLVDRLLLVLASDRPVKRRPLYSLNGMSAASTTWNNTWDRMQAGPRRYSATDGARSAYAAWWLARLSIHRDEERNLRRVGEALWKYALVVQAFIDPIGKVSAEAVTLAARIADRHLGDLATANKKLASETEAERLARKVLDYMTANRDATRGAIMRNVRGASDPAALNASLTRITEMHPDDHVRARALELRAASRTRHERPRSTVRDTN